MLFFLVKHVYIFGCEVVFPLQCTDCKCKNLRKWQLAKSGHLYFAENIMVSVGNEETEMVSLRAGNEREEENEEGEDAEEGN